MSFTEAIQTCFSKIITVDGRARRSEFWYFWLFTVIIGVVLSLFFKEDSTIVGLVNIIIYITTFSVSIRRLHDTGRSGWWWLIGLTGIGSIVLFVFYCLDSQPGANKYGPNPKGVNGYSNF